MHLYFVNITVMQGLLKIGCFFFMASLASSVKSHEIIAFFHGCLESLVVLAEILPKIVRFGDLIIR
jgi:hypothetical protein